MVEAFFSDDKMSTEILRTKNYQQFQVGLVKFEGAAKARPALPGDSVCMEGDKVRIIERAEHKNLVGILEVAAAARYGFTARGAPIYLFKPFNEAYPPFYVGSTITDTAKNVLVVVDLECWEASQNCPKGSCRRIIGVCGDLAAEEDALLVHACPKPWRPSKLPPLVEPQARGELLTQGTTFHVDPPGCRDIDDAITYWKSADKGYSVRIHIADVTGLLEVNPWLLDAERLGQTLYRDGHVVAGMLPPVAEGRLSLLPGQERQVLSLCFELDGDNSIKAGSIRWIQERICVKESYTYETILQSPHAEFLERLATTLRGSGPMKDSHDWIAEQMLFYNREAAKILRTTGKGILRRHSPPDQERLSRLEGFGMLPKFLAYSAGEYCAADAANIRHWGLSQAAYCHASSPIRRWADCVNQAAIKEILFGQRCLVSGDPVRLNAAAKRAKAFERDTFFSRILLGDSSKRVGGCIIDTFPAGKIRIWVEAWKQIVTARMPLGGWGFDPAPGGLVEIDVFCDACQICWKRRLVLKVKTSSPKIDGEGV